MRRADCVMFQPVPTPKRFIDYTGLLPDDLLSLSLFLYLLLTLLGLDKERTELGNQVLDLRKNGIVVDGVKLKALENRRQVLWKRFERWTVNSNFAKSNLDTTLSQAQDALLINHVLIGLWGFFEVVLAIEDLEATLQIWKLSC